MKCIDVCYRLRWHTLLLAALLAAGCAAQLSRDVAAPALEQRCVDPEVLVCERRAGDGRRACGCVAIDGLQMPDATTLLGR